MLRKFIFFSCLAIVFLTSCQKDLKTQQAAVNSINPEDNSAAAIGALTGVADTSSKWYGTYTGLLNPYPTVADSNFIKNGIAQLPYLDRQFYFSNISYDIPDYYTISGDSISLEAKVKDQKATGFVAFDIILQLIGDQHTAEVHFVADPAYTAYTEYHVGTATRNGLSELVHYFGTFQTIKLGQKNYYTGVYINNTLVYKFKYGAKNSIGKLKTISISFKGYGSCTMAGLKNSFTSKPIMSEDFNTDGKSNTLYY